MKEYVSIWVAILIAVLLFITGITLGIAGGRVSGKEEGYKRAYQDLHDGKIEKIAQEKYPALWIKHNIPTNKGGENEYK